VRPGGPKGRLAKAAGADPSGGRIDKNWHAACARSTFGSQKLQSTPAPEHFWKIQLEKMARRLRAKHICKSKVAKHTMFGALLEDAT